MSRGEDSHLQHWMRRAGSIARRVTGQLDRLEQSGTISRIDHRAIEHDVRILAHAASNIFWPCVGRSGPSPVAVTRPRNRGRT